MILQCASVLSGPCLCISEWICWDGHFEVWLGSEQAAWQLAKAVYSLLREVGSGWFLSPFQTSCQFSNLIVCFFYPRATVSPPEAFVYVLSYFWSLAMLFCRDFNFLCNWTEEMVLWTKLLLCKLGDLRSDPQPHRKA